MKCQLYTNHRIITDCFELYTNYRSVNEYYELIKDIELWATKMKFDIRYNEYQDSSNEFDISVWTYTNKNEMAVFLLKWGYT